MDDNPVFTPQTREQIREELAAAAKSDSRIAAAAHLGSKALGREDPWSDIDLALSPAADSDLNQVVADWTARMYRDYGGSAHYDLRHGETLYRVFLLGNTLQVDLSFWPAGELRPIGPKFKLIFGTAAESMAVPLPDAKDLIGMGWLYALHVRSSIARSRLLQAEYMLSGMRDNVLALMCLRFGVEAVQGRGLDDLPAPQKTLAAQSLARSLEPEELRRAFQVTVSALLEEVRHTDPGLAAKLERPLLACINEL